MLDDQQNFKLQPAVWASIFLSFFLVTLGAYYSHTDNQLLTRYTKEDGFLEWITFILYMSSCLLMLFVFASRNLLKIETNSYQKATLLLIAFVFLFGALEEVSYFQRVIDIEAGAFFQKHNRQAETNIHNLIVGGVNINRLIFGKLFFVALLTHNLILPILVKKKTSIKMWLHDKGIFLPPPLLVVPYLALALVVELSISHSRAKEHLEVLGSIHYFTSLFICYGYGFSFSPSKKQNIFQTEPTQKMWSLAFSFYLFVVVLVAWALGAMSLKHLQF